MNTKQCIKCQETKTLDQFYKANDKTIKKQYLKDGHDYYCKYCRVGTSLKSHNGGNKKPCTVLLCEKTHYAKGMCRKHYARVVRNGTIEHKNRVVENGIYYFAGKPHYTKEYNLNYKYKLSIEEFNERSANGCEICGDKPERTLHVDHDHKCCDGLVTCGKCVRGIVCNRCNKAVDKYETGLMRPDNPLLDKVADYVIKYHNKRYNETNKHNAIIADNLEDFMAKLDGGRNG